MRRHTTILTAIILAALAGGAIGQTFTDLATAQYDGKTDIRKSHVAIDANFAQVESGSDVTFGEVNVDTKVTMDATYTDDVLDFTGATMVPSGSGDPCFMRAGTYASPFDIGTETGQSGMIRLYSTTSAAGTSYDRGIFVCSRVNGVSGTKGVFPIAGLAEANATGTGPNKVQAAQFIAHLGADGAAAKLATLGGDSTAGMYGVWAKVTAGGAATASSGSRVAAVWADNQMSGTVSGEEYGIFATTGASVPDAFIGFETTSSGYAQLLYFDETFNSGAGTCITTDTVPSNSQDARIKVYYNGTQYYIPLWR